MEHYAFAVIGCDVTNKLRAVSQFDDHDMTVNGLKVVDLAIGADSRQFAGAVVEATGLDRCIRMPIAVDQFNELAAIVKRQLEEVGLWDETSFGLWALAAD